MDARTKFNAFVVVFLMVIASMCIVYSKTIYIDDTRNTSSQYITNSLGDISNANNKSELQRLIYRLNGTYGWVEIPVCNITVTGTIYLPSNIWLRGTGVQSILYLDDNVNKSIIKNATGGITNSRISDIKFDGNAPNQPTPWRTIANKYKDAHCILIRNSDNIIIEGCTVYRTQLAAILLSGGSFNRITNCFVDNVGRNFNILDAWTPSGIFTESQDNLTIYGCIVNDTYGNGIVVDTISGGNHPNHWLIDSCYTSNTATGIWIENARDGRVTHCYSSDNHNTLAYDADPAPSGFKLGLYTTNISFDHCTGINNGDIAGVNGANFWVSGGSGTGNNSISYCDSQNSLIYGYYLGSPFSSITNSRSTNDDDKGIYAIGSKASLCFNRIQNSGEEGIYLSGTSQFGGLIQGNYIDTTGAEGIQASMRYCRVLDNFVRNSDYYGIHVTKNYTQVIGNDVSFYTTYGIAIYDDMDNLTIQNNNVKGVAGTTGIRLQTLRDSNIMFNHVYNCNNGIIESSGSDFNIVSFNNCLGCTTPITIVGASDIVNYNYGVVS